MFKNMADLMKQAQEMQGRMQQLQEELARREITGTAGGGMVQITLNGRGEPLRVAIDPQLTSDVEMLEDLILAAMRNAQQQVAELMRQELGGLGGALGGLGIPGL